MSEQSVIERNGTPPQEGVAKSPCGTLMALTALSSFVALGAFVVAVQPGGQEYPFLLFSLIGDVGILLFGGLFCLCQASRLRSQAARAILSILGVLLLAPLVIGLLCLLVNV